MAEQEEVPKTEEHHEEEEDNPNYKPPAPKSLDDIINADTEDESLRKYKEALLGKVGEEKVVVGRCQMQSVAVVLSFGKNIFSASISSQYKLKSSFFFISAKTNPPFFNSFFFKGTHAYRLLFSIFSSS